MDVLTYSDTRANIAEVMAKVVRDKAPVVVTRQKHEAVVIVSLADWNAMEETLHLLSSPANAQRLRDAVAALDEGLGEEKQLDTSKNPRCSSRFLIQWGDETGGFFRR